MSSLLQRLAGGGGWAACAYFSAQFAMDLRRKGLQKAGEADGKVGRVKCS
jgi:hypothetical protein